MSINFNDKSMGEGYKPIEELPRKSKDPLENAINSGERTRFVHKPNPMVERDYQIFEYDIEASAYKHVGDYVLLNKKESRDITEKKVKNLMSILNEKDDFIDLSNLTNIRVLYTIVPEAQAGDQTKMIFRDYDGSGVSKDNAIFTIRKGVMYDRYSK